MSLAIKILCVLLVLGCAGLFILKKPDGTPILSASEFLPDITAITSKVKKIASDTKNAASSSISNMSKEAINEGTDDKSRQASIYRWKDNNGQWQFSDTPPKNKQAEAMTVSGNLNRDLVASYEAKKESPVETESTTTSPTPNITPMTISPDKISKLMDDAGNIQKLMDDRAEKMNQY